MPEQPLPADDGIVIIAQAPLQSLQLAEQALVVPAQSQIGEKLGRIAQFFALFSQFVPLPDRMSGFRLQFANGFALPLQRLVCQHWQRRLPARRQPGQAIQQSRRQRGPAPRRQCYAASGAAVLAGRAQRGRGRRQAGVPQLGLEGGKRFQRQHIQVARFAEYAGQPFQVARYSFPFPSPNQGREYGKRGSQPADRHAGLVDGLGLVPFANGWRIGQKVPQTFQRDALQRLIASHVRLQARNARLGTISGQMRWRALLTQ
ncbi:hypothetical protein CV_2445 [Chromobacterium violaceum ATCC 12472]|uniref:Uncharacterized protein n=1 Tax=Chromobacterium violaceum (strain ATCC 12472 / DSM 30191 / JCM 1249 / CCUG 213 / NBRC 12614 / NCIMB 9131 / NCTC 9757 / MK) TaxID=243365 RepID=Q7NV98_CHRVO|nr:hypothetical protein CV_2445 [Chromobacterium violaceum ATCC 12472]